MDKVQAFVRSICFASVLFMVHGALAQLKPSVGIDFGVGPANMSTLYRADNPLVRVSQKLTTTPISNFTGSFFIQLMKARKNAEGNSIPGYGLKVKANYTNYVAQSEDLYEELRIAYVSVPILFKFCLSANEVDVPSSRDPDTYEFFGDEVYFYPGQYSPGYRTTRSFFLYAGIQPDFLKKANYQFDNGTSQVEENIMPLMNTTNMSLVGGLEVTLGRVALDISYQYGRKSITKSKDVFIDGLLFRFGLLFI